MASIRFPSSPIRRTALLWALAWAVLGISCRGDRGTADVMGPGLFWEWLTVGGLLLGAAFGALYAAARRRFAPPGGRRHSNEPLGLKGRAWAGLDGLAIVGVPSTVLTVNPAIGAIMGALGFLSAALLPGNADITD